MATGGMDPMEEDTPGRSHDPPPPLPPPSSASQLTTGPSENNPAAAPATSAPPSAGATPTLPAAVAQGVSKRKRGLGVVTPNACTECRKKRAKVCPQPRSIQSQIPSPFAGSQVRKLIASCLHSATDRSRVDGASLKRTSNAFTRFRFANPRILFGMRSSSSDASSAITTRFLLRLSAPTSGKRSLPACATGRVWNRYRNGLGPRSLRGAVRCPPSAVCLAPQAALIPPLLDTVPVRTEPSHPLLPGSTTRLNRPPPDNHITSGTMKTSRVPGVASSRAGATALRVAHIRAA